MRRVNEAVREVVVDAIAELKDPRIGFVTVTSVETSPDLRQARVYVSVLGTEDERAATLEGLAVGARRPPAAVATRAAHEAHADAQLRLRRARSTEAMRISELLEDERRGDETSPREPRRRSLDELRAADRFLLTTHEDPDGDALGSLLAMHRVLDAARQGLA